MNRYQSDQDRRDRYERDGGRQNEQFSDHDRTYGDDSRSHGQMGEGGGWRDSESRSDNFAPYGYGGGSGERERGRYQDGDRYQDRDRGDQPRRQGGGYSSNPYRDSGYGARTDRGFGSFTGSDYGGRDYAGPGRQYGAGRGSRERYGAYGEGSFAGGGYGGGGGRGRDQYDDRGDQDRGFGDRSRRDDRGFFDKASDEVASWFGDEEAARRREQDHTGRGPANYTRSDERILEDACEHLTRDWRVDAQNIQVTVQDGEVTLDGTVSNRDQKRHAEDCVHDVSGVKHIQNNLRIQDRHRERTDRSSGTLA